jgi:single-stranded-DNA-specific exonuclease
MNYKLIDNSLNDVNHVEKTIFYNRGIQDIQAYTNTTDDNLYDFSLLDNIDKAVDCIESHINENDHIHIVVDSDPDGYTSAAILYSYLKRYDSNLNITYSLHTKKQHGISDDIEIPDDTKLLIVPDAGSNDIEQCKKFGKDIVILDHHLCDKENPYAIIVNNQMCNYPNKQLSGVGVVYKFLQALDDRLWNDFANDYLDLVALGLIADVMNITELENKRLIDKGLNNITNKLFQSLCEKQSYSMGNTITPIGVQFYIVPLINGMIRAGDSDEKELLFQAFIENDQIFKYKKRGEENEIEETIYDRVARLCANAKTRQNRSKDKSLIDVYKSIETHKFNENKIIFGNVTKVLKPELTGMAAIKVAEHYGKPCLLLRQETENKNLYGGSGRNINNSPIEDLKAFLDSLGVFNFVQGHENAFGFQISKENIPKAIELINEKLKSTDMSKVFMVDFLIDVDDLSVSLIRDIDNMKKYYGTGFQEPYIAVENVELFKDQTFIMGKENNTWKSIINDETALLKFKCNEEDKVLAWKNDSNVDNIKINLVGKASISTYKSILTPQIIIDEYQVIN